MKANHNSNTVILILLLTYLLPRVLLQSSTIIGVGIVFVGASSTSSSSTVSTEGSINTQHSKDEQLTEDSNNNSNSNNDNDSDLRLQTSFKSNGGGAKVSLLISFWQVESRKS